MYNVHVSFVKIVSNITIYIYTFIIYIYIYQYIYIYIYIQKLIRYPIGMS